MIRAEALPAGRQSTTDLPRLVVTTLDGLGLTLGTCESLTAGLVAATLADVPGASAVLRGGLVTYASDLKVALAGVDAVGVERDGVVNEQTARQMAVGARARLTVDLALACTGVAGPDPQDGVAPGTVWIAVAGPGGASVETRRLELAGGRAEIRHHTVDALLGLTLDVVRNRNQ